MLEKRYLRSIRLLSECMQSFEKISSKRVRSLGFTDSQFDIIATLGNTPGMTCKELGEKTLITKGTLTGVLDRLEQKGLIQRERGEDRRQLFVKLTPEGELQFANAFPEVVKQGREIFSEYQAEDYDALEAQLLKLKLTLTRAS
jgi:MarR family 2-MHQ and catechol resistance regulon transcriptional repressor